MNPWPRADEKPREVGPVRRRPADVRRPDSSEESNAHTGPDRQVHRPRRPIIGSPDAQPAATPDAAVGDRTPFLRLPRHPGPLPFSGADLPSVDIGVGGTTVSIGPADLALLVTAVLAIRALCAPPQEVPSPWLVGAIGAFAAADRRQRRSPNAAAAVTAAGKLADFAVLDARRGRVPRHAPEVRPTRRMPRRLLHRCGRLGRRRVHRQRRQAGRDRSWASTTSAALSGRWRSCSVSRSCLRRDRGRPSSDSSRSRRRPCDRPRRVAGERARPLSRHRAHDRPRARAPRPPSAVPS